MISKYLSFLHKRDEVRVDGYSSFSVVQQIKVRMDGLDM